ncbi:MAG TPA: phospholipase D-like domain-containing protein [Candidatus Paceibacterota bacterium]|nr:phospholipase D-like domain-containing protein [Candidatus Paceibacterota bacterium]
MDWLEYLARVWQYLVAALSLLMAVLAAGHALLYKRDSRAAVLWVALSLFLPLVGPVLYFILGVNRIKRRAILLRGDLEHFEARQHVPKCDDEQLAGRLPAARRHLAALAVATAKVHTRPLLPGNRIEPLRNGDAAYPAMLEAMAQAQHSIALSTYIFDRDEAGLTFAKALGDAVRRGVEVRLLIDATGTRYSWPSILGVLRRERVPYARFLSTLPVWQLVSMNLRNHRKILVVDGRVGFTGGLNLRVGHWLAKNPRHPVRDIHFRIQGPVVAHLQEVFADDWFFTTREALRGPKWFPPLLDAGPVIARGIADGPDEDFEKLLWTLRAALTVARQSIRIATPYFLPDATLISALNLAALRGVAVDILLPAKNNLPLVQWASTAHWWQMLERGCRIWLSPPPFDHSKLFIVDDCWVLLGSTNWDPRSLRLNFEFNVEAYDPPLAESLAAFFDDLLRRSRPTSLEEVDSRSLPVRLRDGAARLLTPFL